MKSILLAILCCFTIQSNMFAQCVAPTATTSQVDFDKIEIQITNANTGVINALTGAIDIYRYRYIVDGVIVQTKNTSATHAQFDIVPGGIFHDILVMRMCSDGSISTSNTYRTEIATVADVTSMGYNDDAPAYLYDLNKICSSEILEEIFLPEWDYLVAKDCFCEVLNNQGLTEETDADDLFQLFGYEGSFWQDVMFRCRNHNDRGGKSNKISLNTTITTNWLTNPVSSNDGLILTSNSIELVHLYSIDGKFIGSIHISHKRGDFPQQLNPGIYLVVGVNEMGELMETQKLVVY